MVKAGREGDTGGRRFKVIGGEYVELEEDSKEMRIRA